MNRRDFIQRSAVLVGAAYAGVPSLANDLQTLGTPNLVIGILSDLHLRVQEDATAFERALQYFRAQKVDGVIIAGDMADQGLEPQLQVVADTWHKVFPNDKGQDGKHTEKLFIYGNHDMQGATWSGVVDSQGKDTAESQGIAYHPAESWKRCFKEEYSPIWIKTLGGYSFIGAHWHDNNIPGLAEFLDKHAGELGASKPFFYIQHPHLKNTCNGPWAWGQDDGTVTRILNRYPNAVAFSGHSHSPLNDDRNYWQDQFTSIGTASLSYLYPMPARENTYQDDWSVKPPSQMPNIECSHGKQGMLMKVYDGALVFERREFVYDQPVADPWVMPFPISQREPLTFANRRKTAPVPQFASGSRVTVSQAHGRDRYGKEQEQVTVHFPCVLKKDTGVRAFDYEVQVEYEWLDVTFVTVTKRVFSPQCFMGEAQEVSDVTCVYGVSELPSDFRYRFAVRPCECFGKKGDPIYSDWIDGPIVSLTSKIAVGKQFYRSSEAVEVTFQDAPVGTSAWVGIYTRGTSPGAGSPSQAYQYTQAKDGKLTFKINESNEYYAVLFKDEGYSECSQRVPFFVTSTAYDPKSFAMSLNKAVYRTGEAVRVKVSGAPALSGDWVGLYSADVVPKDVRCPSWLYYRKGTGALSLNVSGTTNWSSPLPEGLYFAAYFMCEGYTEPFARQYFIIGTPVTLTSERATYSAGEAITMHYSGLHESLQGTICYQAEGEQALHEAKATGGSEGEVEVSGLAPGKYQLYVCVNGTPVSRACSVEVTSGGTAVSEPRERRTDTGNLAYRLDGTPAGRMGDSLPHGLYIVNGGKVIK